MRKIIKKFNEVWDRAEEFNRTRRQHRFIKIFEQKQRFATMGIYDSVTKKYSLFDTINLTGNFRYSNSDIPQEITDLEAIIEAAENATTARRS